MQKVRVNTFSISLDGFGAGADQTVENPLGIGGMGLHDWIIPTQSFLRLTGREGGTTGPDDDFTKRGLENIGAWILGRNMFGPVRGDWPDDKWKGWWGDTPPYHTDVYVLTHHARAPLTMNGGTTFHFVTDGIHAALDRAKKSAGDRDVRIGGGVSTINQYVKERLIDEMHIAISPVILGAGERLFDGIDLVKLGYERTEYVPTPNAAHYVVAKKAG